MAALWSLNAFISERLTAAAAEILRAVEKTLLEYQRELSRSKQEIHHLRSLLRCRDVTSAQQLNSHSPELCHEEDHPSEHRTALHDKEEHSQRTDQRGPSCIQEYNVSPQFVRSHKDPSSRLCNVERTADIKAEPDDQLEVTDEENWSDEQQRSEQDWSPCHDHQDSDAPQVKVKTFTPFRRQERTEHKYGEQPERSIHDEPPPSIPSHDHAPSSQKGRGSGREGCQVMSCSVNQNCPAPQSECGDNGEGVVNGESTSANTVRGTLKKKRKTSEGGENDLNDLAVEGRDSCPVWPKRMKESGQVENHLKIHTDMLQILLQKVDSVEANMNKLITCVMRIQQPNSEDADLDLQTAKSVHELEEFEERLKEVHFRQRVTHHLGLVGGFTPGECVRRIMRTLASNTVWSNYSLYGKKSKRPLIESTVCTVIKQAVMRSKPGLAEKEAEKLIAETLKHSPAMAKKDIQKNQEAGCPELLLAKEEEDTVCGF